MTTKLPAIFDRTAFAPLMDNSIGFDSFFDRIFDDFLPAANSVSYPPYNIRKDGTDRVIEIALAGFKEEELELSVSNNILTVTGEKIETRTNAQIVNDAVDTATQMIPEEMKEAADQVSSMVPAEAKEAAEQVANAMPEYIYKGIANRKFSRQFKLAENAEVTGATFIDGMLNITVSVSEPEETVKKIAINGE